MMGLIAHPGEISSLSVSGDGNYLITAGGKDLTVNVWKINTQAVQVTRKRQSIRVKSFQVSVLPSRAMSRGGESRDAKRGAG